VGPFEIPAFGDIVTILDTNVLSEIMAPSPSETALKWIKNRRLADKVVITSITVAEILYGIELLAAGKRRDKLGAESEAMFAEDFVGDILAFDEQSAHAFSRIAAARRKRGRPIAEMDAQIAAITLVHGAVLATRNTADFTGCGIRVVNPWVD
jgi:predicted nucleic acid-binding protein